MHSLLFVCTGNICRSPSAEGVMRHKLSMAGLGDRIRVDSAGTHGYHIGEAPDPRSVATAKRRGYDISALRARQVTTEDFYRFDRILALDGGHFRTLTALAPDDKTAELLMFHTADIPDPYYGAQSGFDHALDLIEHACDNWLTKVAL